MQEHITAKFGGSSLADASRIKQVADIVRSSKSRKYIIVSAPGKRDANDVKITNLLYECFSLANSGKLYDPVFKVIAKRFREIGEKLQSKIVEPLLDQVYEGIKNKKNEGWVVSRGEWIMAQLVADYVDAEFVDASEILSLKTDGSIDPSTQRQVEKRLSGSSRYVIPGFYGSDHNGLIQVFPRGGSDITGALIAKYTHSKLYENWTDVNGVFTAQPTIVPGAKLLASLTFKEMRELGYRGAEVLQRDALLPLIQLGVPINVRNTFNPSAKGTLIVLKRSLSPDELIVGVAGSGGFTAIQIQKYGMNEQKGIIEKIGAVLKSHNISFEHNPTGLDSVSIILEKKAMAGKEKEILRSLQTLIEPDNLYIEKKDLALICLVGEALAKNPMAHTKVAATVFSTLEKSNIETRAIISAVSGLDIVIAIQEKDLIKGLRNLHAALFP